jgi:RHS repeat-associated protein
MFSAGGKMLKFLLSCRLAAVCFSMYVLLPLSGLGQTTVGIQPFGTYQSNSIDTISMFDLGVHITIPLYTHKARGRNMGVSVELRYDSLTTNTDNLYLGLNSGPWHLVSRTASGGTIQVSTPYGGDCSGMGSDGYYHDGTFTAYTYSFIDESGYSHPYAGISIDAENCGSGWSSTSLNEYPADGSGYYLSGNAQAATVTDPAGSKYSVAGGYSTITDSNGNFSTGTIAYPDDSGVSVSFTGGTFNYDQNGYPTSRNPTYLKYTDPSGNQQTITINYQTYTVLSSKQFMVDSIVYPDGSSYHFTYQQNPYGSGNLSSLASIQLPTGGVISYSYSNGAAPPSPWEFNTLTRTTSDGSTTYNKTVNQTSPMQTTTAISYADGSSQTINFVYLQVVGIDNLDYGPARALETKHIWQNASNSTVKTTMKCYNGATGDCTTTAVYLPLSQISTVTTLDSGQASKIVESYNASSLPIETDEFDYGSSTPTRKTITTYASLGNYISDRPQSVVVKDGNGTQVASTTFGYDEYSTASSGLSGLVAISGARGNQTSKHVWVNTTGGTLDTHWIYDDAGRMVGVQDPRGNWTQYGYNNQSCQTSVTPPSPSNGVSKSTSATCDPYDVLPQTFTDPNGVVTYHYYTAMLDPSEVVVKDSGGSKVSDVVYGYPSPTTMTTTVYTSASSSQQSMEVVDGFGRVASKTGPNGASVVTTYDTMGRVKSITNPYFSTSDATYGITSYLYDALGRTTYQCQPDDGGTNTSTCTHTSSYKSWTYYGNTTTSRDEGGKQWKRTDDALGRLTSIAEDPGSWNFITNYTYDTLNNLTRVDQWGASSNNSGNRVRTFTWDSLSRLLSASNPESGTTSFSYFSSGTTLCSGNPSLPCTKTNANSITTTYYYDELNRLHQAISPSRNYWYAYDAAQISNCGGLSGTFPVGRLTYVSNNVNAAEFFVYNALGQLTRQTNWTPSNGSVTANPVCAARDWSGNVTQLTYPDGRAVNQQFDSGGNLSSVSYNNWNGQYIGYNYMTSATYWADGAPATMANGNGLSTTWYRNKRMQPLETVVSNSGSTHLLDRQYCYGAIGVSGANCTGQSIGDNGNIFQLRDMLNGNNTQSFGYDNLNRLISFNNGTNSMQQTYTIDPWGNSIQSGTLSSGTSFSGATNNRDSSGTTGYDNAGNITTYNSYYNGTMTHHFAYDDDGEIINVDSGTSTYTYDASGNRVRKDSGGTWTEYIAFGGLTVAEKNGDGSWNDYIFGNGTRLAEASSVNALTPSSSTVYYHSDQIGSTRLTTDGSGSITSSNEFYPYGQGPQPTTQNHYLFSGKERDSESGLDYFGARYYTSGIGRFMSADWSAQAQPVPYAKLDDPQTLNLYAYVRNNPISLVDPDGHWIKPDGLFCFTLYCPEDGTNMGTNERNKATAEEKKRKAPKKYGSVVIKNGQSYETRICGNGECVSYVKEAGSFSTPTAEWKAGDRVLNLKDSGLQSGTVIMLADKDGHYPTGSSPKHAAEFVGFTKEGGIEVRDQWAARFDKNGNQTRPDQPVHTRILHDNQGRGNPIGDASQYYVVLIPVTK